jgi:hypothetical protein
LPRSAHAESQGRGHFLLLSFRHGTRLRFATLGFCQPFPPLGIPPPWVSALAWRTHYGPCDGASFNPEAR